jgi:hypothetical protein
LLLWLLPLVIGCASGEGFPDPSHNGPNAPIASQASLAQTTLPESTTLTTVGPLERPSETDERFYQLVSDRIKTSLAEGEREIVLTPVFQMYAIDENLMPEVLDRIYLDYQDIYQQTPDYFYFNGAFSTEYEVGHDGAACVEIVSLRSEYWYSLSELSPEELEDYVDAVHAEADRWADEIRGVAHEPWQQLAELHDRLAKHITYDYASESHAGWALMHGRTICGGYSQAFQLICSKLGYACRVVHGMANGYEHLWNQVTIGSTTYHVDVTLDDVLPDDCVNSAARHEYLLRSDAAMQETHMWAADQYPPCPADCLLYFSANDLVAAR